MMLVSLILSFLLNVFFGSVAPESRQSPEKNVFFVEVNPTGSSAFLLNPAGRESDR
jgi:hypothetical protein